MKVFGMDPQVFAALASLLVAVIAVGLTVIQLRAARRMHKESTSKGLWKEYLQSAINHPELASPNYDMLLSNPLQFEKYQWYVSFMLYACEEILDTYPRGDSREWEKVIKDQLVYHEAHLTSNYFVKHHYSPSLQSLIGELKSL